MAVRDENQTLKAIRQLGIVRAGNLKALGIPRDRIHRLVRKGLVVRNALGERSATCIDPHMQVVSDNTVCLVSCRHSPEPVFLKWKGTENNPDGDFYVRNGPSSRVLNPASADRYIRTRWRPAARER